jgi:hypothetical protein
MSEMLVLTGLTAGQKAKYVRLSLGMWQIDLASWARVQPIEVSRLEHDRFVRYSVKKRIFATLGLEDEDGKGRS